MKTKLILTAILCVATLLSACKSGVPIPVVPTTTPQVAPQQTPTPFSPQPVHDPSLPDLNGQQVVIAVENAYLPFNYIESESEIPDGWDYAVWNEICRRLNCQTAFSQLRWEDTLTNVASGFVDVAGNGITILPGRAEIVDFSQPVLSVHLRLLVRADENRFANMEQLVAGGGVVGALFDTTYFDTAQKYLPETRIKGFHRLAEALQALVEGEVDGLIADDTAGQGIRGSFVDQVQFVGEALDEEQLGFAFPKGSTLVESVNQTIKSMEADGVLSQLTNQYFGSSFSVSYVDITAGAYGDPLVVTNWLGEYFDNIDLNGKPVVVRDEPQIDFTWGANPPDPALPPTFSARWTRTLNFRNGKYLFLLQSDDGSRLFVDNNLVMENWNIGVQTGQITQNLSAGQHTLRVEYFDQSGHAEAHFTWQQYPQAIIGTPSVALTGQAVQFSAAGSLDYDGSIVRYQWDFGDGTSVYEQNATHTYSFPGVYTVQLTVVDDQGLVDSISQVIKVEDARSQYPVAVISGVSSGFMGQRLVFDGSYSFDRSGGKITGYIWDFGDGTSATGALAPHVYARPGLYPLTLTVINDKGLPYSTNLAINIATPEKPQAVISGPTEASEGQVLSYSAKKSIVQPGLEIIDWIWDFGDGSTAHGASITHKYAGAGSYRLTLTIVDNVGQSAMQKMDVQIKPPGPVPSPKAVISGANQALEGTPMYFNGSQSYDPTGGSLVSYEWDFGDGEQSAGSVTSHAYTEAGYYNLKLTVRNQHGQTGSTSSSIYIYPFQPGLLTPTPTVTLAPPGPLTPTPTFAFTPGVLTPTPLVTVDAPPTPTEVPPLPTFTPMEPTPTEAPLPTLAPAPHDPPIVRITIMGSTDVVDQLLTFSGADSISPDGSPLVSFTWDMGNGDVLDGMTISYAYHDPGSYLVTLTVTDEEGATGTSQITLILREVPPPSPPPPPPEPYPDPEDQPIPDVPDVQPTESNPYPV